MTDELGEKEGKPASPTEAGEEGKWICLDWYDGPLTEITLVTFPASKYSQERTLVEMRSHGGWVGKEYMVGRNDERFYMNHMRFTRRELQAMIDLIDGKHVPDFFD